MWAAIFAVCSALFSPIAGAMGRFFGARIDARELAADQKKQKSLADTIRRTAEIRSLMAELRVLTQSDRIVLCMFENGEVFSNRNPIWKVRCADEVHGPGVSGVEMDGQPILIARLMEIVNPLFSETELSCLSICGDDSGRRIITLDVQQMPTSFTKNTLEAIGVHTAMVALLTNENGGPMGFLSVQFCSFGHPVTRGPADAAAVAQQVSGYCRRLETILNGSVKE